MNSEHKHQLYGGEVSDYMVSQKITDRLYEDPAQTDKNIGEIYSTQVQGKKSIDTRGIFNTSMGIPPMERDPQINQLEQLLSQTLGNIAQQLNIGDNGQVHKVKSTLNLKNQTNDDIDAANQRVLQAMKELEDISKTT